MLRMRGFRLLVAITITLALASTGFAWPKGGGGGNGGGEDPPLQYYELTILGSLSGAKDHNEHGDFVGQFTDANGDPRAFMYLMGMGFVDLNSLLPADSEWTLRTANSINYHGAIVGVGRRGSSG